MLAHSPRAFPWETEPPVGNHHVKEKHLPKARAPRPRERTCLNKKCGRKYHASRWNQRYCQDPECLREVNRWLAARQQAKRREDINVKAQHAQAEQARLQRVKPRPQPVEKPELAPPRGHTPRTFFPRPLCDWPGCYQYLASSIRNPARYNWTARWPSESNEAARRSDAVPVAAI